MANDDHDYVTVEKAHQIAEEHFGNRQPPEGKTWLDVFTETSLLRRDPPPYSKDFDPLDPPSELIRFSFQRFQDFLMANTLVAKITDMRASTLTADEDASNSPGEEFLHSGPLILFSMVAILRGIFDMIMPNWEQK